MQRNYLFFVITDISYMQNYIWNYGDYYTRDKSKEYNKRLIAVGPQNKRESIGHRFCPDYYLDIDESDLITKEV